MTAASSFPRERNSTTRRSECATAARKPALQRERNARFDAAVNRTVPVVALSGAVRSNHPIMVVRAKRALPQLIFETREGRSGYGIRYKSPHPTVALDQGTG